MKTLLVQIRPDKATQEHELKCFLSKSELPGESIVTLNVFERLPVEADLEGIDALVIGGSGDYLVSDGDIPEEVEAISNLLRSARNKRMPILAICFGQQIMAPAFGGKTEKCEDRQEIGTFRLTKTKEAKHCPLFSNFPEEFDVQLGHKDHVTVLPEGAINLAYSLRCDVQAFTFPGEKIYGLTFHPELDAKDIDWRVNYYAENYGLSDKVKAEISNQTHDTDIASTMIKAFYSEVVEKGRFYGWDLEHVDEGSSVLALNPMSA